MNIHTSKAERNKNQSVANTMSHKRITDANTFQLIDNRLETITQRKLLGTNVIQGMFTIDGMTLSQGRKYIINNGNNKQLLGRTNAPPPMPQSLFNLVGVTDVDVPYRDPGTGEEYTEKEAYNIYRPVVTLNENCATENPNDCGMYAKALIDDKGPDFDYKPNITEGLEVRGEVDMRAPDPKVRKNALTGEMYLIKTDDEGTEKHHGATVIAEDGPDHITSEAHSSKELDVPEFAMYGSGEDSFYAVHHSDYDRSGVPAYMQILGKKG